MSHQHGELPCPEATWLSSHREVLVDESAKHVVTIDVME
jgi:hypothetical protein